MGGWIVKTTVVIVLTVEHESAEGTSAQEIRHAVIKWVRGPVRDDKTKIVGLVASAPVKDKRVED